MPVYIRILKPSKMATNCPDSHTICLKIVQKLPLIFLKVPLIAPKMPQIAPKMPQIAPIVPQIVPNVPNIAKNDPIVKHYPTENNFTYQGT